MSSLDPQSGTPDRCRPESPGRAGAMTDGVDDSEVYVNLCENRF
jgi:hypothetical protein